MDVHKETISIAVLNSVGKLVMDCVVETKATTIVPVYSWPAWKFACDL